ncbi:hypothetical protein LEMLEM_LOCUS13700 [Lemmus lemmus]
MNRATEVLKERKGSRGYQGWTDWMPHAHWEKMAYQSKAAGTSDASNLGLACVCLYIGYLFLYSFHFLKMPKV